MQFLHINECSAWCRDHSASVTDDWRLVPDATLVHTQRILFAPSGSLGLEPRVADACLQAFGAWDECLLWITGWEIWPSSENWPAFYAARGAAGELTSLHHKPGHVFRAQEISALRSFLLFPLVNGWDADVLPVHDGRVSSRLEISHDGWVDLHTQSARPFALAAV